MEEEEVEEEKREKEEEEKEDQGFQKKKHLFKNAEKFTKSKICSQKETLKLWTEMNLPSEGHQWEYSTPLTSYTVTCVVETMHGDHSTASSQHYTDNPSQCNKAKE